MPVRWSHRSFFCWPVWLLRFASKSRTIKLLMRCRARDGRMSIKTISKVCGLGVLLLFVFAALGPTKWLPRSGLGWRIDHFFSYFVLTLMFCLAWRRPFLAGGALMAIAVLLEGLQVFIPGRHADVYAALIGAGGAMAAILPSDFLIRAPRRMTSNSVPVRDRGAVSNY